MTTRLNIRFLGFFLCFLSFLSSNGQSYRFSQFSSLTNGSTASFIRTNTSTVTGYNPNGIDFGFGTETKMMISNSGRVGIGITEGNLPLELLDVYGNIKINSELNSGTVIRFRSNVDNDYDDGGFLFYRGMNKTSTEKLLMSIANNANVGIAEMEPSARLFVNSDKINEGFRLTDKKNSNITMQTYLNEGDEQTGFQAINFNGYYDSKENKELPYNSNKSIWRILADQRFESDNFSILKINNDKKPSGYLLYANEKFNIGIKNNNPKTGFHVTANSIFEDHTVAYKIDDSRLVSPEAGGLAIGAVGSKSGYAWLQSKRETPLLLNPLAEVNEFVGIGFIPDVDNTENEFHVPSGYLLAVNGGAICTKLRIKKPGSGNSGWMQWPDYVFEKDYKLPTLNEVEKYIELNKHLPNVPSAATINQQGYETTEMTAKLLEKIEELTLYVIDLKKQNDLLMQKQKILETKINKLSK